jgi:hypothetical protein
MGLYIPTEELKRAQSAKLTTDVDKHDFIVNQCDQVVLRLVSARTTNGTHMKNAFTRMLTERLSTAKPSGNDQESEESIKAAIAEVGLAFPAVTIATGSVVNFTRIGSDTIQISTDERVIAIINSKWLASNLVAAYVDLKSPLIHSLARETFEIMSKPTESESIVVPQPVQASLL